MTLARDERREAHDELLAQARYYESARVGLGLDFLDAVDAAIDAIEDFPVGIVYIIDDGTLVIFADAHRQRDAGYWTQRLDG